VRHLEVVTDLDAPAAPVWQALTDTAAYPAWNPFVTRLTGDLGVGQRPQVRIEPPGGRPMTFRPTVTVLEPGRRPEWLGHAGIPGVFDGRHAFTVEPRADGGCTFTHRESFGGILVPFPGAAPGRTEAGFAATNAALRVRAERAARVTG
jgi:hypothetical protein